MIIFILVSTALRMLLVGAVAWLVLRLVRVRNPHVEALAWRMLLIAGIALPALLYWRLAPSFDALELPAIVVGARLPPGPASSSVGFVQTMNLLLSIYLAFALLHLARFATGLVGTWLVCRAALPMETVAGEDVRTSARIRSPATFGSTILLPADARDWPAERLEVVLAHERAHVRARDGYWSWLAQLQAVIYWFSPFAWWLWRRLDRVAETTSDDAVVAARHDPVEYAALLLEFARRPNSRRTVMSVAESNIPERIERLLARTPPGRVLPRVARWTALASLVPVAVFAASGTRVAPASQADVVAVLPVRTSPPPTARMAGVRMHPPNIESYYPALARLELVRGKAMVEVDVNALGQLVDARVVSVDPADPRYGFADAALQVARNTVYEAVEQRPSTFRFVVKFELVD